MRASIPPDALDRRDDDFAKSSTATQSAADFSYFGQSGDTYSCRTPGRRALAVWRCRSVRIRRRHGRLPSLMTSEPCKQANSSYRLRTAYPSVETGRYDIRDVGGRDRVFVASCRQCICACVRAGVSDGWRRDQLRGAAERILSRFQLRVRSSRATDGQPGSAALTVGWDEEG